MKLDRLETHDRLIEFKKQGLSISECCQNLIDQRPFGNHPFYIYAHCRTHDNGYTKRLLWQPRLTKPKAQTNSMLFKAYPGSDQIKVIWMIPVREQWTQYESDKVCADDMTKISIDLFQNDRASLERKEEDDLEDHQIDAIYKELSKEARYKAMRASLGDSSMILI